MSPNGSGMQSGSLYLLVTCGRHIFRSVSTGLAFESVSCHSLAAFSSCSVADDATNTRAHSTGCVLTYV